MRALCNFFYRIFFGGQSNLLWWKHLTNFWLWQNNIWYVSNKTQSLLMWHIYYFELSTIRQIVWCINQLFLKDLSIKITISCIHYKEPALVIAQLAWLSSGLFLTFLSKTHVTPLHIKPGLPDVTGILTLAKNHAIIAENVLYVLWLL